MKELQAIEGPVVELGQASVETKGNAIFDVDLSTGPSRYAMGMADD
ncbi:conserved hypothetical protein [Altererythrobacter sp. B11]|nr:hypothetical protein [Altererythrobacter sp. B11]BBC71724.1 conserved hypothetical protein [Altererythrobacter sp. B11]